MKKLMTLCLAVLALALGTNNVLAASAAKKKVKPVPTQMAAASPMPVIEAVWTAGSAASELNSIAKKKAERLAKKEAASLAGKTVAALCGEDWPLIDEGETVNAYRESVINASVRYAAKMDTACKVKSFDVSNVAKNYRVFTPAGMEPARDKLLLQQVATMACITMFSDGEQRAAKIKF